MSKGTKSPENWKWEGTGKLDDKQKKCSQDFLYLSHVILADSAQSDRGKKRTKNTIKFNFLPSIAFEHHLIDFPGFLRPFPLSAIVSRSVFDDFARVRKPRHSLRCVCFSFAPSIWNGNFPFFLFGTWVVFLLPFLSAIRNFIFVIRFATATGTTLWFCRYQTHYIVFVQL